MAISVVQKAFAVSSGLTSIQATFPSAVTPGNLIVAVLNNTTFSNSVSVSDNVSDHFNEAVFGGGGLGTISHDSIWYVLSAFGGSSVSITALVSTSSALSLAIVEVSGGTWSLDGTGNLNSLSGAPHVSVTTGGANDFLIADVCDGAQGTPTPGWTELANDGSATKSETAYKITSSAGTYSASWPSAGGSWATVAAGFKCVLSVPQPIIVQEIIPGFGPPMRVAPWIALRPPVEVFPTIKAPPYPTRLYPPEITFGPPIPGSPWFFRRIPEGQISQALPTPPALSSQPPVLQEISGGPPMPGTPFFKYPKVLENPHLTIPATLVPQLYAPEIYASPPMAGAPFFKIPEIRQLYQAAAPSGTQAIVQEVFFGPPIPGAPWIFTMKFLEGGSITPHPSPPPGPPSTANILPFLARITTEDLNPGKERRLVKFTELLSILVNSLMGQGAIVQTGPASFQLRQIAYNPAQASNWQSPAPTNLGAAIDRIVAWIASKGGTLP